MTNDMCGTDWTLSCDAIPPRWGWRIMNAPFHRALPWAVTFGAFGAEERCQPLARGKDASYERPVPQGVALGYYRGSPCLPTITTPGRSTINSTSPQHHSQPERSNMITLPPYRDLPVGALLTRLAEALPDNEALVYADRDLRLTFAELEAEARLIARGLMACGVQRGERVALWATNVSNWIVLHFSLGETAAILVTVNTSLRAHETEYLLRQSESATAITIRGFKDVDYVSVLREIGAVGDTKLPNLKRAIFISRSE